MVSMVDLTRQAAAGFGDEDILVTKFCNLAQDDGSNFFKLGLTNNERRQLKIETLAWLMQCQRAEMIVEPEKATVLLKAYENYLHDRLVDVYC